MVAGVLVGMLGGAAFALILGIPTLRLRADYLAIATIAAAEVVRLMFVTELFKDWTNSRRRTLGYHQSFRDSKSLPAGHLRLRPVDLQRDRSVGAGRRTDRPRDRRARGLGAHAQPMGSVLKGIREDEDAVRSLARTSSPYKMQALVVGGVIGAVGGIVFILPSAVIPAATPRR